MDFFMHFGSSMCECVCANCFLAVVVCMELKRTPN